MERKHALITGASRGIGRAIAAEFAKAGYDLTITCVQSEYKLNELASDLSSRFDITCKTFIGDISDPSAVERLFKGVKDIDVLINNAGISYTGLLHEMSYEDWSRVINTNLSSAFFCSKLAIPHMLKKKSGKIINVSSVWGDHGASTEVAYSASKGGLNAFTKALARELAPSNIQVNAVACGMIDTDMNSIFNKEEIDSIIDSIPADRIGRPEEAAHLILQLCTENEYLTGQVITLDGGWV
ncbi:MAG: SDR family NAD(P)-dependent oxidoreductase [Lachnospiraceae bacterium]|nr:SDR family NAD(P)-dependent oxidoreductase [Lachnospiraceae bacterium]